MTTRTREHSYTFGEELANSLTHGVGLILAIGGLVWLVTVAAQRGDARHIVACSVYGATMVVLYTASTLYHAIPSPRAKRVLQVVDHTAIYLLIAGTYTPFTLVSLRGPWGWSLFGVVWGLAVTGIVLEIATARRWPAISIALYIAMGWVVVVATRPLVAALPPAGLGLLVAGGLAYTGGLVFYGWKRLPYGHAVWHLFVLAGTVLHFAAVLMYVIPA